jgi:hypothetical protein
MDKGWHKIYESGDLTKLYLMSGRLKAEGIEAIILNKIDSLYGSFGMAELYVPNLQVMDALRLIDENTEDGQSGSDNTND